MEISWVMMNNCKPKKRQLTTDIDYSLAELSHE